MPQQQARDVIGVLGFPFSKGQHRNGTEYGPKVMREGGLLTSLQSQGHIVVDHGDVDIGTLVRDEPIDNLKNPRAVGAANEKLSVATTKVLKMNQSVLILGGDHCMAIGSIHGHVQVEPNIVIVWVDAHADINTPQTSASGNIHGMPLAFLVKELQEYMPPQTPGFEWCKPCISARDIVYIGLRDVDPDESIFLEKFGVHAFYMKDIDKYGINEVVERALNLVDPSHTRPIHLSFDVDSMDPTIVPATGTPVPGGLSLSEGLHLAEEVAKTGRMSVMDIAEVNPLLGNEEMRELTVATTIEVVNKYYSKGRQGVSTQGYNLPRPQ